MKKRLIDMDVRDKKILLRCDFNVPIENGNILDDSKILAALDTIEYLINQGCRIIILSHLGKVKSEEDKKKNTLEPVAKRLKELLKTKVTFSKQCVSPAIKDAVSSMIPGDVLLLENTRHEDYPEKKESGNDESLSKPDRSNFSNIVIAVLLAFLASFPEPIPSLNATKYLPSSSFV